MYVHNNYYVCRYIIVSITGIKYLLNMLYYKTEVSTDVIPTSCQNQNC